MSEWITYKTPEGKPYYFNTKTGQSAWEKPTPNVIKSVAQRALDESPWKEYTEKATAKKYYYNTDTKETTWEMPAEYQVLVDRVSQEIKQNLIAPAPPTYAAPIIAMEFRTKVEAEECFYEMLEEFGVQPDWTWEQTVRKCHMHQMYRALKSVNERKATFEKYCKELTEKQAEASKMKLEQDEAILEELFSSDPTIDGKSKFKTVAEKYSTNEKYSSTAVESRRVVFNRYVDTCRTNEKEKAREERKSNLQKFKLLLQEFPITPTTTWKEIQEMYKNPFAEDEQLSKMDPMDVIISVEDYVMTLDSQYRQERNSNIKATRRKERIHREAFMNLLKDLKKSGKLHMESKWKDLYPSFKDDENFTNMLGDSGSTPLELFWDEIMIMEDAYRVSRRFVSDVARSVGFEFRPDSTYETFLQAMRHDVRDIPSNHLKMAFEDLLYKSQKYAREEKRYAEKRMRKKMDAFKSVLKHLHPSIKLDDKWYHLRERTIGPEFEALEEAQRIQVFEKFLRRLQEKQEDDNHLESHGQIKKTKRHRSGSIGSSHGSDSDEKSKHKSKKGKRTARQDESSSEEGELHD